MASQLLTPAGQNIVAQFADRYRLSQDAIVHMLISVNNGGGAMAQFNCPELGGGGQWMRGGMTMVGDMFNHGLKMTVDNLCSELSQALADIQVFAPPAVGSRHSNQWWPIDLGSPFSSGAQNGIRYAVFPQRLAIESNGQVTVYDTLDHSIGGVSQQQGGDTSLTFNSQYGTIAVGSLPIVSGAGLPQAPQTNFAMPASASAVATPLAPQSNWSDSPAEMAQPFTPPPSQPLGQPSGHDIIGLIESLARLREAGALTDQEFISKKAELLARL